MDAAADDVAAVVLAAGLGKRMRSALPKVLHPVQGKPMVARVLAALRDAGVPLAVVVTGNGASAVERVVADLSAALHPLKWVFAHQAAQLGTGHAVLQALPLVRSDTVLVVPGDAPLLDPGDLRRVLDTHRAASAAVTLLSVRLPDPTGYGRIVRDSAGRVTGIVEERDADPDQRRIDEVFTLVAAFRRTFLESALRECRPDNAQGEIYLPDAVAVAAGRGDRVETLVAERPEDVLGVNDRQALAQAEGALRDRTLTALMAAGVTVVDPRTTFVDEDASVASDARILPMTVIEGPCVIASGCEIGPGAHVRSSRLAERCRVWHSVVEESDMGAGCAIGPFAHLRPGSRLGRNVAVGNFAEVKNAALGDGTKQHHHSYIGDADLGADVNVGAGVITVNYDGRRKARTVVGDGAFLGCNSNLIAPVTVGAGSYVAAGSTCDRPVPADALAIARARQEVKEGWAARRRNPGPEPPSA